MISRVIVGRFSLLSITGDEKIYGVVCSDHHCAISLVIMAMADMAEVEKVGCERTKSHSLYSKNEVSELFVHSTTLCNVIGLSDSQL
jgi:hypothetical protein